MKKLLLLLMIIPMIGFGQQYPTNDLDLCNHLGSYLDTWDGDQVDGVSPVQLIDLLACAARHKNSEFLDVLNQYQYYGDKMDLDCQHLYEFQKMLSTSAPVSNSDIKALNRYVSMWSNVTANYVSPVIPFGGKEYIKVSLYDNTHDNNGMEIGDTGSTLLFTNDYRGSDQWMIIIHPEYHQKAIRKFFKKEKNWHFGKYPKK
tara:strand:+ start:108 stop:713 length:606 start_codon:yes stop_codon:yes gene_type:complete